MTPQRWQKVRNILESALDLAPERRTAFVDGACAGDESLRREVQSLLADPTQTAQFLEAPAFDDLRNRIARDLLQTGLETDPDLLAAGTTLGPYEIVALLGKGGMGAVYRARDPRVGRDVAVKVASARFTDRFDREARAVAALNHPNICTLYDVGPNYLVMEYIEGDAPKGPIPLPEALRIAHQIGDALEAAHEKGIVHRDLKPANIKIKRDGSVKVLDFGLAKIEYSSQGESQQDSPTLTMAATQEGIVLGTAPYMAPEQARGRPVDKRADIWAFGVVLAEMLLGDMLFQGATITDVLAAVVRQEPDWERFPIEVRKLLRKCLEKDPARRLRDIGDVWELQAEAPVSGGVRASSRRLASAGWYLAVPALLAAAGLAFLQVREQRTIPESVQLEIMSSDAVRGQTFSLSPDGRYLAIVSTEGSPDRLWVRALDSPDFQHLAGTEDASYPFWSPDSKFIGFFAQGKLKRAAIAGSQPQILCEAINGRGGTWGRQGNIVFAAGVPSALSQIPAAGGTPAPLPNHELTVRFPQFLPDGEHFLYTAVLGTPDVNGIYLGSLHANSGKRILSDASSAAYVPAGTRGGAGHVLFRRGNSLMAQAVDLNQVRVTGEAFAIAQQVGGDPVASGLAAFSASQNGVLAYGLGAEGANRQLVWVKRTGEQIDSVGPPGSYTDFRLSPDTKRLAFDRIDAKFLSSDIWTLDMSRGISSRLTFDPRVDNLPLWSPDGLRILFPSNRNGAFDLYVRPASGSGPDELLVNVGARQAWGTDWSRDGRYILYERPGIRTGQDLWIAPQFVDKKPFPYLESQFDEQDGRFSPDGKWVAYVSNESGRDEVYVQSFPLSGSKVQISTNGGSEPQWRGDGTELYYISAARTLFAVPIKLRPAFEAGRQKTLIQALSTSTGRRSYAVSNDGERFLIAAPSSGDGEPIEVVLNWEARLRR